MKNIDKIAGEIFKEAKENHKNIIRKLKSDLERTVKKELKEYLP